MTAPIYCAPATELMRVAEQEIGRYDLSALRQTVSAGEAVSPTIAERWQAARRNPVEARTWMDRHIGDFQRGCDFANLDFKAPIGGPMAEVV